MWEWLFGKRAETDLESVYTAKELKVGVDEVIENIASVTAFDLTVLSHTAIFDSAVEVMSYLDYIKGQFDWFHYHPSLLSCSQSFFFKDQQGMANAHLTGYIIMSHGRNGKYLFRGCFVEFHEKVTFSQITSMVCTYLASTVAFGLVGGVVCASHAIKVRMKDSRRREVVQKQLGIGIYNAKTNCVNNAALMEAMLLHYISRNQRFTVSGTEVQITGVDEKRKQEESLAIEN